MVIAGKAPGKRQHLMLTKLFRNLTAAREHLSNLRQAAIDFISVTSRCGEAPNILPAEPGRALIADLKRGVRDVDVRFHQHEDPSEASSRSAARTHASPATQPSQTPIPPHRNNPWSATKNTPVHLKTCPRQKHFARQTRLRT